MQTDGGKQVARAALSQAGGLEAGDVMDQVERAARSPQEMASLAGLDDSALQAERIQRLLAVSVAKGRWWSAICETMVREAQVAWPEARYLGLMEDSEDGVPYWNLVAVEDASGQVLGDSLADSDKFEAFQESFMTTYGGEYEDWFTVDQRPYFDLASRRPLSQDEHDMNVDAMEVQ